nr:MAG TPA: Protein of unknown function (DUF2514) [Caudoviricetes sp.]
MQQQYIKAKLMHWKFLGALLSVVAIFICGYQYAAALYSRDIAELRRDYAERAAALEEKYREKERSAAAAMAAAWEERDRALAESADLRADTERVRGEAAAAKRALSRAGAGACAAERKQLARCADLLAEGVDLGAEGARLSQRVAIDKDALAKAATF